MQRIKDLGKDHDLGLDLDENNQLASIKEQMIERGQKLIEVMIEI